MELEDLKKQMRAVPIGVQIVIPHTAEFQAMIELLSSNPELGISDTYTFFDWLKSDSRWAWEYEPVTGTFSHSLTKLYHKRKDPKTPDELRAVLMGIPVGRAFVCGDRMLLRKGINVQNWIAMLENETPWEWEVEYSRVSHELRFSKVGVLLNPGRNAYRKPTPITYTPANAHLIANPPKVEEVTVDCVHAFSFGACRYCGAVDPSTKMNAPMISTEEKKKPMQPVAPVRRSRGRALRR